MILCELLRLFHRRHTLEWKVRGPEYLLHNGVKTSSQKIVTDSRSSSITMYILTVLKIPGKIFRTMTLATELSVT